jgi:hypothetical protein
LFNNRPYFSRALDPDLTQMVNNEFHVAGANSGQDPWFELRVSEHPWLAELGIEAATLSPKELRRALMVQLMRSSHAPNPRALGHAWTPEEARGAELFRQHCENCHQARLDSSNGASRVPFKRWPHFISSPAGPIVWASNAYEKTGVEPYVHPRGARVPSLRRLYEKFPYFTNGSAKSLADVLARARLSANGFSHAGAVPDAPALLAADRAALLRFLALL